MRRTTAAAFAVALLAAGMTMVAGSPASAATGSPLTSAGSVRLAGLNGVIGADGLEAPEFAKGEENDAGGDHGRPTAAPRVDATPVRAAGAEAALTWAGLNHRDNRLANGGNQFSSEPPDQALCVGPNHVLEAVNTVLRVYDKAGNAGSPVISMNEFFGYPPAIDRTTGAFGAFLTDPVCHFDTTTGRYFLVVLTIDQDVATGDFTGANRLDIAVSKTSDPTGDWWRYKLPVQNDGTEGTPNHGCDPDPEPVPQETHPAACIGDYPHIGADRYGFFITTNEYSFFGDGTNGGAGYTGSQIYAISKSKLAAGPSASPAVTSFESPKLGPFNSFTVWPAVSPDHRFADEAGGTEYFLSSTLGDGSETGNTAPSENRIGVWAVSNTRTLDSASPNLSLTNRLIRADDYSLPPKATQKNGPTPLRECVNDTTLATPFGPGCWQFLLNDEPAHDEVLTDIDANDTRMQQVVYANGLLFGALDTAVRTGRGRNSEERAGVLWVGVAARVFRGNLFAATFASGYVGLENNDITYPALGFTSSGKVVMAATVSGDDHYPSASYTVISDRHPVVRIISEGKGPDDGFTGYKAFVGDPPRPRWGDYGATAFDGDTLWVASESIEQSCTLAEYLTAPIGSCGATRTALANWGTRVTGLHL